MTQGAMASSARILIVDDERDIRLHNQCLGAHRFEIGCGFDE